MTLFLHLWSFSEFLLSNLQFLLNDCDTVFCLFTLLFSLMYVLLFFIFITILFFYPNTSEGLHSRSVTCCVRHRVTIQVFSDPSCKIIKSPCILCCPPSISLILSVKVINAIYFSPGLVMILIPDLIQIPAALGYTPLPIWIYC